MAVITAEGIDGYEDGTVRSVVVGDPYYYSGAPYPVYPKAMC